MNPTKLADILERLCEPHGWSWDYMDGRVRFWDGLRKVKVFTFRPEFIERMGS